MVNRLVPFSMPMDRVKRLIGNSLPIISVVVVFLVYVFTLLPGVGYSGDTAKFQFVGKVLGPRRLVSTGSARP